MTTQSKDFYSNKYNQKALIADTIISKLNLFTKNKHSFYPYLNRIMLFLQRSIVISIVKEEEENSLKLIYTTASDLEVKETFIKDFNISLSPKSKEELLKKKLLVPLFLTENYYLTLSKINFPDKMVDFKKVDDAELKGIFEHFYTYFYKNTKKNIYQDLEDIFNKVVQYSEAHNYKDTHSEYIQDALTQLEEEFKANLTGDIYNPHPYCIKSIDAILEKKIRNKKNEVLKVLRKVLDDIYSEFEKSPLIYQEIKVRGNDYYSPKIFLSMRTIKLNGLRRDNFNYTTQVVLSKNQREELTTILKAASFKAECKKKECKGKCVYPDLTKKNLQSHDEDIKKFLDQIEQSLGNTARSVTDYVTASGVMEYIDHIKGFGRNYAGEEYISKEKTESAYRQLCEICLFERAVLRRKSTDNNPATMQIPIRVWGCTWLTLFVIISKDESNWGYNYQIYRQIYTKIIRNIRKKMQTVYIEEFEKILRKHIQNDPFFNKDDTLKNINDELYLLQFIYPAPIFRIKMSRFQNEKILELSCEDNKNFTYQINEYDKFKNNLLKEANNVKNRILTEIIDNVLSRAFKDNEYDRTSYTDYTNNSAYIYKDELIHFCNNNNEKSLILLKGTVKQCELFTKELKSYCSYQNLKTCELENLQSQYTFANQACKSEVNVSGRYTSQQEIPHYLSKMEYIHFANYKKENKEFFQKYQKKYLDILSKMKLIIISGEDIESISEDIILTKLTENGFKIYPYEFDKEA